MALLPPPPPLLETSNKAYKNKDYPKKAKGMSFFAFIFFIFIYIFIFYIFNISPKSLLNNTKFWFFIISNTLIFIIATDYGIFSSLVEKHDLHDEYLSYTTQARNHAASFVAQYHEIVKTSSPKEDIMTSKEKKKIICVPKSEPPERILGVIKSEPKGLIDDVLENKPKDVVKFNSEYDMQKKMKEARKFSRSKSERCSARVDIDGGYEKKSIMRRSRTEKHESRGYVDEFSTMSDEEVNKRVEEFIQRFNRQIRLQRETNVD